MIAKLSLLTRMLQIQTNNIMYIYFYMNTIQYTNISYTNIWILFNIYILNTYINIYIYIDRCGQLHFQQPLAQDELYFFKTDGSSWVMLFNSNKIKSCYRNASFIVRIIKYIHCYCRCDIICSWVYF